MKFDSERILGKNWQKQWIVLHEDSSLEWYQGEDEENFQGGLLLKVRFNFY